MIKAVLFDMDGVLADSDTLHCKAYQDTLGSLGVTISEAEYARTRMIEPSALGRLVKPEEVAAAALFLASDASSAITGTTLRVNAGRM